ncbi:MAG: hypothetical protein EP343_27510 [Deltaproteobacteria bacterium]|nr:MAG: hypothetical protein EP343_27510 [Deltaproteobacteria bacterium]
MKRLWIGAVVLFLWGGVGATTASAHESSESLWKSQVLRGGFHFHASFGVGGGPTSLGLFHTMEIGHTFKDAGFATGWTLAYDHVFLLSPQQFRPEGAADMFGGHFLLLKIPLGLPHIVGKIAVGLGESVDLTEGFVPYFGFGWHYGLDFHFPATSRSGVTIGLNGVHSITGQHGHLFGFGLTVGYTWF